MALYIFIFSVGLLTYLANFPVKRGIFYFTVLSTSISLSFNLRSNAFGAKGDLGGYAQLMSYEFALVGPNIFEPLIYALNGFLYRTLEDVTSVFILVDLFLLCTFAWCTLSLTKLVNGVASLPDLLRKDALAVFLISLCTYPFLMGMLSTYRQWAASVLFIAALLVVIDRKFFGWLAYLASIGAHNAMLVFGPLAVLFAFKNQIIRISAVVGVVLGLLVYQSFIPSDGYKVARDLGRFLPYGVAAVVSCLTLLLLMLRRWPKKIEEGLKYLLLISALSPILLSSGDSVRLTYTTLMLLIPLFLLFSFNRKNRAVVVLVAVVIFFISLEQMSVFFVPMEWPCERAYLDCWQPQNVFRNR